VAGHINFGIRVHVFQASASIVVKAEYSPEMKDLPATVVEGVMK
jgi:hypothetical protein